MAGILQLIARTHPMNRNFKPLTAGLLALTVWVLCAAGALAQTSGTRVTACNAATPNNALCISWTHDGKDTNGNTIAVTFRVEQQNGSTWSAIANNLTAKQFYVTGLAPGSYTFRVFAVCSVTGCVDSQPGVGSGTATAPPVQPSQPVIIIAATIRANGPPIYRIIQSVNLRPSEVVMVAPASMRPLFSNP
jgi:hypothetical protein